MSIILTKVTWYSRLLAVIFFLIGFPILTFYIGTVYEATKISLETYGATVVAPASSISKLSASEDAQASPVATTLLSSGIHGTVPHAEGSIIVKKGGSLITESTVPASGKFLLFLDPGTYTLSSDSNAFAQATVVVKANMMASIMLSQ